MHRVRKCLASVMLMAVAGIQAGCGESSVEPGVLKDAVTAFDRAQQGFVPEGTQEGTQSADTIGVRAYRQQALREAGARLDAVIESGSASQQIAAGRLRAGVDASAAHYATREATLAYAALAPRAVKLMSQVAAADRAMARGQALDVNQPELIRALEAEVQQQTQRRQELQHESDELTAQLKAQQAEQAAIRATRDKATAAAQALREQAFIAKGDQRYDLYDQAAKKQREASTAAAEMERRQLDIDMLNSRLGVVNSQLSLANELLAELKGRADAARRRQQEIEQAIAAAMKDRDAALDALAGGFQGVMAVYREQVDAPLAAATQRMAQAVAQLQAAQKLAASGPDAALAQSLRADVLGALTTQSQLLTEHLRTVRGFHQILEMVSNGVQRIDPQQAAAFDAALSELAAKMSELAAKAQQTIASAQQLADQLGGASGGIAAAAKAQSERLARLATAVGEGQ